MTQRERILAIMVGGMLIGVVVWWGMNKYQAAVKKRTDQIASLEDAKRQLDEKVKQGYLADRQMAEYMVRSLPGDPDLAQSTYQQWLFEILRDNRIADANVTTQPSIPMGDLYHRLRFRFTGQADVSNAVRWLHGFYAKDYLHRITRLSMRQKPGEKTLTLEVDIDAIALTSVPAEVSPPGSNSWRVDGDLADYFDPIMNRNFFEPPNQSPRYDGDRTIAVTVGQRSSNPIRFVDPESNPIDVTLVGEVPENVSLDRRGTLNVYSDEVGEFRITVRATDGGYPPQSTEQDLTVRISEAPEPPPPPPQKLAFDDATQTVLTGLTHGRDEWTAWIRVMTKGTTLKLRERDQFEIGSLKGTVVEINQKYVVLEVDGRRFDLKPNDENLKKAADRAMED